MANLLVIEFLQQPRIYLHKSNVLACILPGPVGSYGESLQVILIHVDHPVVPAGGVNLPLAGVPLLVPGGSLPLAGGLKHCIGSSPLI